MCKGVKKKLTHHEDLDAFKKAKENYMKLI
jgi:hypothetical protein